MQRPPTHCYRGHKGAGACFGSCWRLARWPTYGYRRITAQSRRGKWRVNRKRVHRLMCLMDLQAQIQRRKQRTTNSKHDYPRYSNLVQALEVVQPEQVWVADITYVRLQSDFVYLAVLVDVFTRAIRGWHLGHSLDGTLTLKALRQTLEAYAASQTHHSDQGIQYAATAYSETLQATLVEISTAEVSGAWQNGNAERLIRTRQLTCRSIGTTLTLTVRSGAS